MQFLGEKITATLTLGLYKINSKTRLGLTTLPRSKIKSAQVTTSYSFKSPERLII